MTSHVTKKNMESSEESVFVYLPTNNSSNHDNINSFVEHSDGSTENGLNEDMTDILYKHKDPFNIFLIIVYVASFIVGFMGNLFVIVVVTRHRKMRTLTNVFFLNLTVGDLMVTCICIPITLGNYIYSDWIYGETFCKVTPFLQTTAVAVSVLSMLSISINRYFAIHIPLQAKILFSKTRVHVMLFSMWLISIGTSSPLLVVKEITEHGVPDVLMFRVCSENWGSIIFKHAYDLITFLVVFLCPLVVMSMLYLKISIALWSNNIHVFDNNRKLIFTTPQVDRQLLQRRQTVRTLVLLVVLFACSWLPYHIVNAWLEFNVDRDNAVFVNQIVYPLVQVIGLSNSSVNPILYCFLSRGFRRAFVNMCCRRKLRTRNGMVLTGRYRCSEDSGVGSVETVLS